MKTIDLRSDTVCFQGDIMITAVREGECDGVKQKDNIISHSETGHHHIAERAAVLKGTDPMVMFLKHDGTGFVDGVPYIDIVHKRSYDTHETIRLFLRDGLIPKVSRQEEWTPEGWQIVQD